MRRGAVVLAVPALVVVALALATILLPSNPAVAQTGCAELAVNGGFESTGGWTDGNSPVPPQRVGNLKHTGSQSLLLGIVDGRNQPSFSSARQLVSLPGDAGRINLSFWYYAVREDDAGGDYAEVQLLSEDGFSIRDSTWRSGDDGREWKQVTVDLSRWRGQRLQLYFNVFNDGQGGRMGIYLDDVSLVSCTQTGSGTPAPATRTGTPLPTRTPWVVTATYTPYVATPTPWVVTATRTPRPLTGPVIVTSAPTIYLPPLLRALEAVATPSAPVSGAPLAAPGATCVDLVSNGNFEAGFAGWTLGKNRVPARVVTQPYSGNTAAQLGSQISTPWSYSSIRQTVQLPSGYPQLLLQFASYTWSATGPAGRQEAALLTTAGALITKMWRTTANDQAWTILTADVTPYAGSAVQLYFNAVNDPAGGYIGLYLDEVHLWACSSVAPVVLNAPVDGEPAAIPAWNVIAVTPVVPVPPPASLYVVPGATPLPLVVTIATATPQPMELLVPPTFTPKPAVVTATPAGAAITIVITPGSLDLPSLGLPAPQREGLLDRLLATLPAAWRERSWVLLLVIAALVILGLIYLVTQRGNRFYP